MRRLVAIALALSLMVVALGSGCSPQPSAGPSSGSPGEGTPIRGGTLRFGVHRDVVALDPHIYYGATSASLQGNVYDGLVRYTPNGKIEGALAESWDNPDEKTWVFRLRSGVKFHNGNPLTSDDVVFSLKRIMDPAVGATRGALLRNQIMSVERVDDLTVKITMRKPDATFLNVLAGPDTYIVDKEWAESGVDLRKQTNGTGPFMLVEFEPQVKYVLRRNPNYWETGKPYLDEVVLVPIQDDKTRINALRNGELDLAEYIPWHEAPAFKNDPFRLYSGYETFNSVRLNVSRPPLDNRKVRQALNYIIDREEICKIAFGGEAKPITSGWILEDSWAFNTELKGYWKKDHDKARRLLAEAGFSDPSMVELNFESANVPVHLDTAQVILQQLQAFGLKVNFKVIDIPVMMEKRSTGDYQMMMDGHSLPWPDPDAYAQFFHSREGAMYARATQFSNPTLDALLEQGRSTLEPAERKKIYAQAERIILDEAPWIFVLWRPQSEASSARVHGFTHFGGGAGYYSTAYLERIWAEK